MPASTPTVAKQVLPGYFAVTEFRYVVEAVFLKRGLQVQSKLRIFFVIHSFFISSGSLVVPS